MADFINVPPIPERFRDPVRQLLRRVAAAAPAGSTDADVRALLDATAAHGIEPLLYRGVDASLWPPPIAERWRRTAIVSATLEPLRLRDLQGLLALFAEAAIETLILKGTALAYSVYPEPHLRPRGDTDLLIRPRDRQRADVLLRAHGFRVRMTSGDEHAIRQLTYSHTDPLGAEHAYDVHWAITNTPVFAASLGFEELHARSIALPRIAPNARGLSHVDALLYACIHRVAHHHASDRLNWLYDIQLLRELLTPDERRLFWRTAAEKEVVAICRDSFASAAYWVGEPCGADGASEFLSESELAHAERSARYLDRDARRGSILFAEMQALPWRSRVVRLAQLAFPPAPFMREHFGATPLPLAYGYRALRGCARLFRKVARKSDTGER